VHSIRTRKRKTPFCAVKLDMMKAYIGSSGRFWSKCLWRWAFQWCGLNLLWDAFTQCGSHLSWMVIPLVFFVPREAFETVTCCHTIFSHYVSKCFQLSCARLSKRLISGGSFWCWGASCHTPLCGWQYSLPGGNYEGMATLRSILQVYE
jgi:hypothetical protein